MNQVIQQLANKKINSLLPLPEYFTNDIWESNALAEILHLKHFPNYNRKFRFDMIENPNFREEVKRYFYTNLTSGRWCLATLVGQTYTSVLFFSKFISDIYPDATSILDCPHEKIRKLYLVHLKNYKKARVTSSKPSRMSSSYSYFYSVVDQVYKFLFDLYDDRSEQEKDIWSIEKLGLPYNMSRRETQINFTNIHPTYRGFVKKYFYHVLVLQRQISIATAFNILKKVYLFFNFIAERHPDWTDTRNLQRTDIEAFLEHVWKVDMGGNSHIKIKTPSNRHVSECIANTRRILEYAQIYGWNEAPKEPVHLLLVKEDMPRREKKNYYDHIKHIPDHIWEQVQNNLHLLHPSLARLVLVMEASGFRVSDVCQLDVDCLVYKSNGWWLKGDQRKVNHIDHLVPISEEIVTVVKLQQEYLQTEKIYNPYHFLFPHIIGKASGKAMSQKTVRSALERLAEKLDLRDTAGNIYNFKNHAFRHRYGVNLINNGMQILHVQKLMAHTSPEMTLTYARILDDTLRKEWEKAHASIRLNVSGTPVLVDISVQAEENGLELDWIRHHLDSVRMDHGFCIKSPKLHCDFLEQTLEPPCIKNNCRSFHVDTTFLEYYTSQIDQLESDVAVYMTKGRTRSIELVQLKIKRYKEIRDLLLADKPIMGIEKEKREYVRSERHG